MDSGACRSVRSGVGVGVWIPIAERCEAKRRPAAETRLSSASSFRAGQASLCEGSLASWFPTNTIRARDFRLGGNAKESCRRRGTGILCESVSMNSRVRFFSFPRTQAPPPFVLSLVQIFRRHEPKISTESLEKGLESDPVLRLLASDLSAMGFDVETGKERGRKIERPVFYGESGEPSLRYEIDAYHPEWKCGLEVEAGRAILGNAVFRDLFQAMVMTDVNHLCLAVPNIYKYKSGGRSLASKNYEKTVSIADALYGHSRVKMPYGLTVVGY